MNVFLEIKNLLNSMNIRYHILEHKAVFTSEEAAIARNEDIRIGAKAIVLKADDRFIMAVLSAAKKIDSKKLKKILKVKSLSFAVPEKVKELTNCSVGSVPPFGNLFNLDLYVDESIKENKEMAFNAGLHNKSIKMKTEDYFKVLNCNIEDFSKDV